MASSLDKGSVDVSSKSTGSYEPMVPFASSVPFTPARFDSVVPFTPDVQYPQGSKDDPVSSKTSST